jgi:hypothetical protein
MLNKEEDYVEVNGFHLPVFLTFLRKQITSTSSKVDKPLAIR